MKRRGQKKPRAATRVGKIRVQVELPRNGNPCSFSRHAGEYGGCLRQVARRLEYLARRSASKTFCFPSYRDLRKFCRKGKTDRRYSVRQVRACIHFLLGIGWIREGIGRDARGVPRKGYFLAPHDQIAHKEGKMCMLNENFSTRSDALAACFEAPLVPEELPCDSGVIPSEVRDDSALIPFGFRPDSALIPKNGKSDSAFDSASDSPKDGSNSNESGPLQKDAESPAPLPAPPFAASSHRNHVNPENPLNPLSHSGHLSHLSQGSHADPVDHDDHRDKATGTSSSDMTTPPGLTKTSLQGLDTNTEVNSKAEVNSRAEPDSTAKPDMNPHPEPEPNLQEDEGYETIGEHFAELIEYDDATLEDVVTAISDGVARVGSLAKCGYLYRDELLKACWDSLEEKSEEPFGDDDTERKMTCSQIMYRAMELLYTESREKAPKFWVPVMKTLEGKLPAGRPVAA